MDGTLSLTEARRDISEKLAARGYAPLPGQEGTIKDLRTMRRQNVALETNLAQVQGFARWERQQEALGGFPAQQFVRLRMSRAQRPDWPERFAQAVARTTPDGANVEAMAALVNHPCWSALSVFGAPYAPFDFNSGMGLEPLDRDEAEAMGLLPGDDADPEHAAMVEPQSRGLNETLEASPAVRSQDLRTALAESVQGLAKWAGDTLVFLDPNGTKPYTADKLAEVWKSPLPASFADLPGKGQMQREAYIQWAQDHGRYDNHPGQTIPTGGKDYWEDLQRVIARLKPSGREANEMFRGISFDSAKAFGDFLARTKSDGYAVRPKFPAESWAGSFSAARKYAALGDYQVILRLPAGHTAARDVSPLTRAFSKEISKGESPQGKLAITDDEILLPQSAKLKVKAIRRAQATAAGKTVEVILEEAR